MQSMDSSKPFRTAVAYAIAGTAIGGLIVPVVVLLDINGVRFSSGFSLVDSLLASAPGIAGIACLAVIYAIYGFLLGLIGGLAMVGLKLFVAENFSTHRSSTPDRC